VEKVVLGVAVPFPDGHIVWTVYVSFPVHLSWMRMWKDRPEQYHMHSSHITSRFAIR
jgi:hypothetical protein